MFKDRTRPQISIRNAMGISLLAAVALGVGACGAGTTHASTAASENPAAQSVAASDPAPAAAVTPTPAAAASAAAQVPLAASPAKATPTVKPSNVTHPAPAPNVTSPAPTVTAPPKTAPALPARRQPTAAEMNQVIASVHSLIPLFTPTSAQIVTVGNQVCTAFDQGKTVAQVKATAMQMAGAYAALIPDSVATSAVHTVVAMFCPGYISKLV